jgi:hypothetical protein
MAMGNLLAKTPFRKTSDGTFDDEDYYSESDEIVYCGEESLDLVRVLSHFFTAVSLLEISFTGLYKLMKKSRQN